MISCMHFVLQAPIHFSTSSSSKDGHMGYRDRMNAPVDDSSDEDDAIITKAERDHAHSRGWDFKAALADYEHERVL